MSWAQPVVTPQKPCAMTAALPSALLILNAVNYAVRLSAPPACHSIRLSIRNLPAETSSPNLRKGKLHRAAVLNNLWPANAKCASARMNSNQERGGEEGHELDDWLRAEEEIKRRRVRAVSTS
jgi:DUF2934 family protein